MRSLRVAAGQRSVATVKKGTVSLHGFRNNTEYMEVNSDSSGPMQEYNARVSSNQLRDDEHQRGCQALSYAYNVPC